MAENETPSLQFSKDPFRFVCMQSVWELLFISKLSACNKTPHCYGSGYDKRTNVKAFSKAHSVILSCFIRCCEQVFVLVSELFSVY